jgi:hypothetical protein
MNDVKLNDYRGKVVELYFELLQEAINEICKPTTKKHVKDAVDRFFEVLVTKHKMILPTEFVKHFFAPVSDWEPDFIKTTRMPLPSYAYTKEAEAEMWRLSTGTGFDYDDYRTVRFIVQQVLDRWKSLCMKVYRDTPDSNGASNPT